MQNLLRAWELAQEDLVLLDPEESLQSAAAKLLWRKEKGVPTPCGIVQDKEGRFLGTLSTHRALRLMGQAMESIGAFDVASGADVERAIHAACRMVGGDPVRKHMYLKALRVSPHTTVPELLKLFSGTMAHFAVVIEADRALGLLELDDLFQLFAQEMLREHPSQH